MHEQRDSSSSRPATLDEIVSREETRHGGKGKAFPTHAARLPVLMNVRNGRHLPTLERPILGESGMAALGKLADGPLFTVAVFPVCGPHEQYSKDEYGSRRKMTDGGG